MSFKVRKATTTDTLVLLDILNEALAFKRSVGDEAWGSGDWTAEEVDHAIAAGNTYIAEVDGTPAGSVIVIWSDKRSWGDLGLDNQACYIHRLTTGNTFRGQGVGEQMIDWAAEQARSQGRTCLRLDCTDDNTKLRGYYEKLGFQLVGIRHNKKANYSAALYERAL